MPIPFRGSVNIDIKDSVPDWEPFRQPMAPEGAPSILYIVLDDTVSTEIKSTRVVKKIGHGRTSMVEIVTTPSGTYSTDGLLSPHVRYPGIEVESKRDRSGFLYAQLGNGFWSMVTRGSFTYITYKLATKV